MKSIFVTTAFVIAVLIGMFASGVERDTTGNTAVGDAEALMFGGFTGYSYDCDGNNTKPLCFTCKGGDGACRSVCNGDWECTSNTSCTAGSCASWGCKTKDSGCVTGGSTDTSLGLMIW
jgi:hypothetical protein